VPPGLILKNSTLFSDCAYVFSTDLNQTETFSLRNISRLVLYNWRGECLLRSTHWILI